MVKKRESNIKVGITCKCQDAAVARPPSLLRKVQCKKCGIFFRTNRQTLVSVHAIQKIENYFLGKIIVQVKPPFKDKITVSREKIAAMKLWLNY